MTREWSGAEKVKEQEDEEDGMLLSGDGDAAGSLWMAMASGGEDARLFLFFKPFFE
jgi:hypothetical protein